MDNDKFDIFKFITDRKYSVPLTDLDKDKFDPYMALMIISMYPRDDGIPGSKYYPYIRGLNSIAFHRLDKTVQAKAYESFNGQNLYRTKWLKPKSKESEINVDIDKIARLLELSDTEVQMAISSGEIDKDKCLDLYTRLYEPESLVNKRGKKR